MQTSNDIIGYRLKRSDETFEVAQLLFESRHYNSVVNRLYYAAFYSVSALLYKDEIFSKTHSGLKTLFHQHFIKTKKLSEEYAEIYKDLFENRQDGDYSDFVEFTREDVEPLIERTQKFINEIKKLI